MGILDQLNAKARKAAKATALLPTLAPKGVQIIRGKLVGAVEEIDKLEPQDLELMGRVLAIPSRIGLNAVASAANSAATQLRNVDIVAEVRGRMSDEDWAATQERLGVDFADVAEMVKGGAVSPIDAVHGMATSAVLSSDYLRNFVQDVLENAEVIKGHGDCDDLHVVEDDGDQEPAHEPSNGSSFRSLFG
jgi:hypothetical protein